MPDTRQTETKPNSGMDKDRKHNNRRGTDSTPDNFRGTGSKQDGRRQRSEESQARILNAATKIFAQKGLEGSRIDEIAQEANLNKRMIYHYFESKENLYVEVLRLSYNKIFDLCKNAFKVGDDPKENITRAIRAYFYYLADNEEFVRLTSWEALGGGRYLEKVIHQVFDLMNLEFDHILKDAIKQKIVRPDTDIRQLVISVQSLCFGYFGRRQIIQPIWEDDMLSKGMLEDRLEHILTLLFEGIVAKEEEAANGSIRTS